MLHIVVGNLKVVVFFELVGVGEGHCSPFPNSSHNCNRARLDVCPPPPPFSRLYANWLSLTIHEMSGPESSHGFFKYTNPCHATSFHLTLIEFYWISREFMTQKQEIRARIWPENDSDALSYCNIDCNRF